MKKLRLRLRALLLILCLLLELASPLIAQAADTPKLNVKKKTIWVNGELFDFDITGVNYQTQQVRYSVDNPEMVKVDAVYGKVRGLSVGQNAQTTLRATVKNRSTGKVDYVLTATIYVKETASQVKITNKDDVSEALTPGEKLTLVGTMYNKAGKSTTQRKRYVTDYRKWTSTNPSVVSVNETSGKLTAKKEGRATIWLETYVDANFTGEPTAYDSVTVTVVEKPLPTPLPPTPTPSPTPTPVVFALSAVRQTSLNKVEVTFTKEAEHELTAADFTVKSQLANYVLPVTELKMAVDKKSAELTLGMNFDLGGTHTVSGKDSQFSFKASSGVPKTIIVESGLAAINYETPVNIYLYDANGIEVTTDYLLNNVVIEYDMGYYNPANRTITMYSKGDRCIIRATYHTGSYSEGYEETFSSTATYTAVEPAAIGMQSVKAMVGTYADFTSSNTMITLSDTSGWYIFAQAIYSNGAMASNLLFESTDDSVLIVGVTGELYPISEGKAAIKIMDGSTVLDAVEITIGKPRIATGITLDKHSLKLSQGVSGVSERVKVTVRDQYGQVMLGETPIIELLSGIGGNLPQYDYSNNSFIFSGSDYYTSGRYLYRITCYERSQTVSVNVVQPGAVASRRISLEKTVVDLNFDVGDEPALAMEIKMFKCDAAGNPVSLLTGNSSIEGDCYGYTITRSGEAVASSAFALPNDGIIRFDLRWLVGDTIHKLTPGSYTVVLYRCPANHMSTGWIMNRVNFSVTDSQARPVIAQNATYVSSIYDTSAILSALTINGNSALSNNINSKYSVTLGSLQYVGSNTVVIDGLVIRENVGGYYIEHTYKNKYAFSTK